MILCLDLINSGANIEQDMLIAKAGGSISQEKN